MRFIETMLAENGNIKYLNYHEKRVYETCGKYIKLNLNPPKFGLFRVRIIYSQTIESIEYLAYEKREIKTLQIIEANDLSYEKKYENRQNLNNLFKKRKNADDILIVKNSYVTDTTIANIAFYDGKNWLTPTTPLLLGTTRARLLDEKFLLEADIKADKIDKYEKFALMNALIGFLKIENGIIRP